MDFKTEPQTSFPNSDNDTTRDKQKNNQTTNQTTKIALPFCSRRQGLFPAPFRPKRRSKLTYARSYGRCKSDRSIDLFRFAPQQPVIRENLASSDGRIRGLSLPSHSNDLCSPNGTTRLRLFFYLHFLLIQLVSVYSVMLFYALYCFVLGTLRNLLSLNSLPESESI